MVIVVHLWAAHPLAPMYILYQHHFLKYIFEFEKKKGYMLPVIELKTQIQVSEYMIIMAIF